MSDGETEASEVSLSSPSQKFIPQDDDDETLWEVIEITAEKRNSYKVKWKGTDPKTMKPWPQSWVLKTDCTDDLVGEWKLKQKLKAKGRKSVKGGRASTASKKTARYSTSMVGTSNTKRPSSSNSKETRLSTSTTGTGVTEQKTHRSSLVPVITKASSRKSKANTIHHTDDDDLEPSHATGNGKKRKLENATSANSSANHVQRHTSVDVNVDPEGEVLTKKPRGRPRKKRKVEVQVSEVEPVLEDDMDDRANAVEQMKQEEESYEIRKITGKFMPLEEEEEEAEEERMVDDVLSQPNPRSAEFNIDDIYVQSERGVSPEVHILPPEGKDKGKGKARDVAHSLKTFKEKDAKSTKETRTTTRHVSRSSLPPIPDALTSNSRAQSRMPTAEISVFWDDPKLSYHPQLSPAALERLAQFDEEVMGIPRTRSTGATARQEPTIARAQATIEHPLSKEHKTVPVNDKIQNITTSGRKRSPANASQASGAETSKSRNKQPSTVSAATTNARDSFSRPAKQPMHDPEIIPETDLSSQSQSQSQDNDTTRVSVPAIKPQTKPSSPSNKQDRPAKTKKLAPVPQLSPSVFHPHLPPSSSLPEDISEEPSQSKYPTIRTVRKSGADVETPTSSIEQFDSPEKGPWKPKPDVIMAPKESTIASKGKQRESTSEMWESNIMRRGRELAEVARQRDLTSPKKKKSLLEVIAKTQAQGKAAAGVPPPPSIPEEDERDLAGTSTEVVPPASEPQVTMNSDDRTFLEMERAYVDLSGGTQETQDDTMEQDNAAPVDPTLLRREEEESTQDLRAEMWEHEEQLRQDQDKMDGIIEGKLPVQPPGSESEHAVPSVKSKANSPPPPVEKIVEQVAVDPTPAPNVPEPRITRARSRSQTSLHPPVPRPPSRANSRGAKATKNGMSSAVPPTIPEITEIDTAATQRFISEIADLQAQLAAERAKNAELLKEKATAVQEMQAVIDQTTKLKADHDAAQLAWEDEKLHLSVNLDAARKAQASSDKDVDFFREQYAKASGFVTATREENKDLEKRIKIAEEQTQTGVNLVKATFELRCKTLEEDLKSWRKMAEFLIEKDRRTDNDTLRRRAAEEPELRALCQRQAASYTKVQGYVFALEGKLQEKRREHTDLESYCQLLKGEATRLAVDLSEATTKLERIGRADDHGTMSLDETENGHEFVYRCKWRSQENVPCQDVFSTLSELEQHLLLPGGHLH